MSSTFEARASLVAQRLKRLPAMQETWVRSLGREDPLEKEMVNPLQYSCLENPMEGGAWWATVHGVAKSWTRLSTCSKGLSPPTALNRELINYDY